MDSGPHEETKEGLLLKNQELQKDLANALNHMQILLQQSQHFEGEAEYHCNRNLELEASLEELAAEAAELKEWYQKAVSEKSELRTEKNEIQASFDVLNEQFHQIDLERVRYKSRMMDLEDENDSLREEVDKLRDEIERHCRTIGKLKQQRHGLSPNAAAASRRSVILKEGEQQPDEVSPSDRWDLAMSDRPVSPGALNKAQRAAAAQNVSYLLSLFGSSQRNKLHTSPVPGSDDFISEDVTLVLSDESETESIASQMLASIRVEDSSDDGGEDRGEPFIDLSLDDQQKMFQQILQNAAQGKARRLLAVKPRPMISAPKSTVNQNAPTSESSGSEVANTQPTQLPTACSQLIFPTSSGHHLLSPPALDYLNLMTEEPVGNKAVIRRLSHIDVSHIQTTSPPISPTALALSSPASSSTPGSAQRVAECSPSHHTVAPTITIKVEPVKPDSSLSKDSEPLRDSNSPPSTSEPERPVVQTTSPPSVVLEAPVQNTGLHRQSEVEAVDCVEEKKNEIAVVLTEKPSVVNASVVREEPPLIEKDRSPSALSISLSSSSATTTNQPQQKQEPNDQPPQSSHIPVVLTFNQDASGIAATFKKENGMDDVASQSLLAKSVIDQDYFTSSRQEHQELSKAPPSAFKKYPSQQSIYQESAVNTPRSSNVQFSQSTTEYSIERPSLADELLGADMLSTSLSACDPFLTRPTQLSFAATSTTTTTTTMTTTSTTRTEIYSTSTPPPSMASTPMHGVRGSILSKVSSELETLSSTPPRSSGPFTTRPRNRTFATSVPFHKEIHARTQSTIQPRTVGGDVGGTPAAVSQPRQPSAPLFSLKFDKLLEEGRTTFHGLKRTNLKFINRSNKGLSHSDLISTSNRIIEDSIAQIGKIFPERAEGAEGATPYRTPRGPSRALSQLNGDDAFLAQLSEETHIREREVLRLIRDLLLDAANQRCMINLMAEKLMSDVEARDKSLQNAVKESSAATSPTSQSAVSNRKKSFRIRS